MKEDRIQKLTIILGDDAKNDSELLSLTNEFTSLTVFVALQKDKEIENSIM